MTVEAIHAPAGPSDIPVEFILFGLTLVGVAAFYGRALRVALLGLAAITLYKIAFTGFKFGTGVPGLAAHMGHEWVLLANLLLLLTGFAILSRYFEASNVPEALPAILPDDWKGGFALLTIIAVLSSVLDNIAAALLGGTMAKHVFRGRVHIGFVAAIVAASNAGGAGSVLGDTTTTMMWICGVSPLAVLHAYVAGLVALFIFGIPAALYQQRFSPIVRDPAPGTTIEWMRLIVVLVILLTAVAANVAANVFFPEALVHVPVIGLAVWAAILFAAPIRRPDWGILPEALAGAIFLLALVTCASMMPVERLPAASWQATLGLGFISAVFDNIPLTSLALRQGGYDWGLLAFAVGFGGSMVWFGSSAGVAISNIFPEAKSAVGWLRHGWFVAVAYVVGFFVMLAIVGWSADPSHPERRVPSRSAAATVCPCLAAPATMAS